MSARRKTLVQLFKALYQWHHDPSCLTMLKHDFRQEQDLEDECDFFEATLHSITCHQQALDTQITCSLNQPLHQLTIMELALLRLGCHLLNERKLQNVGQIISECLLIAKQFLPKPQCKIIHAILDKIAKAID